MTPRECIIHELVRFASERFSSCETIQDFLAQQRIYTALLTERIDELLAVERAHRPDTAETAATKEDHLRAQRLEYACARFIEQLSLDDLEWLYRELCARGMPEVE